MKAKPRTYQTVSDVMAVNKKWFADRLAKRGFFGTRVESGLIDRKYFITSERDNIQPRAFTVRRADPDGTIDTMGEFRGHETLQDAREAVTREINRFRRSE